MATILSFIWSFFLSLLGLRKSDAQKLGIAEAKNEALKTTLDEVKVADEIRANAPARGDNYGVSVWDRKPANPES